MLGTVGLLIVLQSAAPQSDKGPIVGSVCSLPKGVPPPPPGYKLDCADPANLRAIPDPSDARPKLGPGLHELIVHWASPGSAPDYRRVYRNGAACLRAREALLKQSDCGGRLCPIPPYAACVPVK